MIQIQAVEYGPADAPFQGVVAYEDQNQAPRPVVLVAHTIRGQTDFEAGKAEALAREGYIGFAIDLYGKGKRGTSPALARTLMDALNADRRLLLQRLETALEHARRLAGADPERIGAIGFCFGGKCVLDLARSGADVAAVASFHGLYDPPGFDTGKPVAAKILVLHGWDDPLAPPESVLALGQELTRKGAHWELIAYGHTGHAFTNPLANDPEKGLLFNPVSNERAWARMLEFLQEMFPSQGKKANS